MELNVLSALKLVEQTLETVSVSGEENWDKLKNCKKLLRKVCDAVSQPMKKEDTNASEDAVRG